MDPGPSVRNIPANKLAPALASRTEKGPPPDGNGPAASRSKGTSVALTDFHHPVSGAHVHVHLREGDLHTMFAELGVDDLADLRA